MIQLRRHRMKTRPDQTRSSMLVFVMIHKMKKEMG